MTKENPKPVASFIQNKSWEEKSHPIWAVTSFNLKRNIARFNFPSRLSKEEMNRLIPLLTDAFVRVLGKETMLFFPTEELTLQDKEFLYEHFLCEESFQNAGAGQGVVITATGSFLALFNIDDHINLQWLDCKAAWEDTWNLLAKLEKEIGDVLAYAFSPKFGYLTSRVENCGTALKVCAYLHLPALSHGGKLPPLLHSLDDVRATGMEGTKDHLLADFILLKNAVNLGVSEQEILRSVHLAATKLIGAERAERSRLANESNAEMKDLITRAYGLLAHSYQLSTRETLSALSMIKLGIDLGWVQGLTDPEVNTLFMEVRRAHLLHFLGISGDEEIQHQRAAFMHKKLKDVQLKEALR